MMKFLLRAPPYAPVRRSPMRIAYLECFSGISGDMFLGALLDAGVRFELLQETVAALNIGATLEMSRVDRSGISGTKLDVIVDGEKDMPREEFWAAQHSHSRSTATMPLEPQTPPLRCAPVGMTRRTAVTVGICTYTIMLRLVASAKF